MFITQFSASPYCFSSSPSHQRRFSAAAEAQQLGNVLLITNYDSHFTALLNANSKNLRKSLTRSYSEFWMVIEHIETAKSLLIFLRIK